MTLFIPPREAGRDDLSDLIDRNAAFAPDKPAIHFARATLSICFVIGLSLRLSYDPAPGAHPRNAA